MTRAATATKLWIYNRRIMKTHRPVLVMLALLVPRLPAANPAGQQYPQPRLRQRQSCSRTAQNDNRRRPAEAAGICRRRRYGLRTLRRARHRRNKSKGAGDCAIAGEARKIARSMSLMTCPGWRSEWQGMPEGKLFSVQSQGTDASAALTSGACPSELRLAASGRVACFAPGDMGSMGGGRPPSLQECRIRTPFRSRNRSGRGADHLRRTSRGWKDDDLQPTSSSARRRVPARRLDSASDAASEAIPQPWTMRAIASPARSPRRASAWAVSSLRAQSTRSRSRAMMARGGGSRPTSGPSRSKSNVLTRANIDSAWRPEPATSLDCACPLRKRSSLMNSEHGIASML